MIGERLGGYQIVGMIGRGGMGVVYRAKQVSLDRQVALKILPPGIEVDEALLARFEAEAHAASRINHPNLVQVYDVGSERGIHYIAMELVEGEALGRPLGRDGSMDCLRAAAIASQVAAALAALHAAGIVHRDIKPSNVMVRQDGLIKLTDFGVALLQRGAARLTSEGRTVGTPTYMSPEQARGLEVDGRSDVYSLGVILYHMLAGRPPFEGDSALALMRQHCDEQPPPLRRWRPDVPDRLVRIVAQCLAKDPAERYQTAEALAADLDHARLELEFAALSEATPGDGIPTLFSTRGILAVERERAAQKALPARLWHHMRGWAGGVSQYAAGSLDRDVMAMRRAAGEMEEVLHDLAEAKRRRAPLRRKMEELEAQAEKVRQESGEAFDADEVARVDELAAEEQSLNRAAVDYRTAMQSLTLTVHTLERRYRVARDEHERLRRKVELKEAWSFQDSVHGRAARRARRRKIVAAVAGGLLLAVLLTWLLWPSEEAERGPPVGPTPPAKVANPNPADGAVDVPAAAVLSWSEAAEATGYRVYWSAVPAPWGGGRPRLQLTDTVPTAQYDPPALLPDTTYFWRIDAMNSIGITEGDVWRFATAAVRRTERPPPKPEPVAPTPPVRDVRYHLADLGTLPGGAQSWARDVNDTGQVVGYAETGATSRPFLWEPGTGMVDLGVMDGDVYGEAYAINKDGHVAGFSTPNNGRPGYPDHGLVWLNGPNEPPTVLPSAGGRGTTCWDINNAGQVTGHSTTAGDVHGRCYRYDIASGQMTVLSPMPGHPGGQGFAINDSGWAVGQSASGSNACAVIYSGPEEVPGPVELPRTAAFGRIVSPMDISTAGKVVGSFYTADSSYNNATVHAAYWESPTSDPVDLGTLGGRHSQANAVNDAGEIVGYAETAAGQRHAAIWTEGRVSDLNGLIAADVAADWTLVEAAGVNGGGQIVGHGIVDGRTRAFLLTPIEPGTGAVGAVNWQKMEPGTGNTVTAVWGTGPYDVFAVGLNGTILHYDGDSDNDGRRDPNDVAWEAMPSPVTGNFLALFGTGHGDVYAATQQGSLIHCRKDTGGRPGVWRTDRAFPSFEVRGVWCAETGEVFVAGESPPDGVIAQGSVGSWSVQRLNSPIGGPMGFLAIWGVDASDVLAVAADGISAGVTGVLYRYDGSSWTHEGPLGGSRSPYGIWGTGPNEVFVAGQSSGSPWRGIVHRYDEGASPPWGASAPFADVETLNDVWGRSGSDVYVTGYTGKIARFNGTSFEDVSYGSNHWSGVWACGPEADPGTYDPVLQTMPAGAQVALDGSGSSPGAVFVVGHGGIIRSLSCDPSDLTYTWTGPFPEGDGTVHGATPTVTLPVGDNDVTLVVHDGTGSSAPVTVTITVDPVNDMPVATEGPGIVWSSYLGGSGYDDMGYAAAVDDSGNVFIAGRTTSSDFPLSGLSGTTYSGGEYDGFLAKIANSGKLLWSRYLGGSHTDMILGMAVDASGNVFVTGGTFSSDFPLLNASDVSLGGTGDAFAAKVSSSGELLWSTYLGGEGRDGGTGIAVDKATGEVFVTGNTQSSGFPSSDGAEIGGTEDAFVAKLNSSSGALVWSRFLGGRDTDRGQDIAVDASGDVFVTGSTRSADFPSSGGFDTDYNGGSSDGDAFVTKISGSSGKLMWSSFLGAENEERGWDLEVEASGNVFVTGWTNSSSFPSSEGFGPSFNGGMWDAFVTKVSGSGQLLWSSYLGAGGDDVGQGIAVDASGDVFVTTNTNSSAFPSSGGFDTSQNGSHDASVTKISGSGALVWSSFLGAGGDDEGIAIAADASGNVFVTGQTWSTDFPSEGGFDTTRSGARDAFVTKIRGGGGVTVQ